ncbi:CHAD domain-containing protein [Neptunomonas antarctica]|uniref:CHAD domain-containing protein n=1 Tax=Neptunomonas antarctica TaxID=619304 RepID=A0A1N7M0G4_9GAMM|nr:CHAD domain-containing protein [Neptunomonas antarctica]SIS79578.1 CHAD domain-containing protein [Neptunomonas antarctica]
MQFTLRANKPLAEEIRRIAFEQLDGIDKQLTLLTHDRQDAIHEMRKHIKRIRALLRLLGNTFGKRRLKKENRRFRDMARLFALHRDEDAQLETFERLTPRLIDTFPEVDFQQCRAVLISRQHKAVEQSVKQQTKSAQKMLVKARKAIAAAPLNVTHQQLRKHFIQTSKQARHAFTLAVNDPVEDHFHEWRKCIKDLLYQSELLKKICLSKKSGLLKKGISLKNSSSDISKKYRIRLDQLAEMLGDYNDICEMLVRSKMEPQWLGDGMSEGALEVFLEDYLKELEHQTTQLGLSIFRPDRHLHD